MQRCDQRDGELFRNRDDSSRIDCKMGMDDLRILRGNGAHEPTGISCSQKDPTLCFFTPGFGVRQRYGWMRRNLQTVAYSLQAGKHRLKSAKSIRLRQNEGLGRR